MTETLEMNVLYILIFDNIYSVSHVKFGWINHFNVKSFCDCCHDVFICMLSYCKF